MLEEDVPRRNKILHFNHGGRQVGNGNEKMESQSEQDRYLERCMKRCLNAHVLSAVELGLNESDSLLSFFLWSAPRESDSFPLDAAAA